MNYPIRPVLPGSPNETDTLASGTLATHPPDRPNPNTGTFTEIQDILSRLTGGNFDINSLFKPTDGSGTGSIPFMGDNEFNSLLAGNPPANATPTESSGGSGGLEGLLSGLGSLGFLPAASSALDLTGSKGGIVGGIGDILKKLGHGSVLPGLGNLGLGALFGLGEAANIQLLNKESGVLDTLVGLLNKYAAMTPEQAAAGIKSFEQPMGQDLLNTIMRQVQAQVGERGFADSPGLMAEATAQALAPYQFGEQQLASSNFFNLEHLPLDVRIPNFAPQDLSGIINFLAQGGFGRPGAPGQKGGGGGQGSPGPPGPGGKPGDPGMTPDVTSTLTMGDFGYNPFDPATGGGGIIPPYDPTTFGTDTTSATPYGGFDLTGLPPPPIDEGYSNLFTPLDPNDPLGLGPPPGDSMSGGGWGGGASGGGIA